MRDSAYMTLKLLKIHVPPLGGGQTPAFAGVAEKCVVNFSNGYKKTLFFVILKERGD